MQWPKATCRGKILVYERGGREYKEGRKYVVSLKLKKCEVKKKISF